MEPKQTFTKTWRVENSGSVTWGEGAQLVFKTGAQMGATSPYAVSSPEPGRTIDVSLEMVAPATVGRHTGEWHLQTDKGIFLLSL